MSSHEQHHKSRRRCSTTSGHWRYTGFQATKREKHLFHSKSAIDLGSQASRRWARRAGIKINNGKKLPRLVDLGAGKCIPCKKMAPILEDLKKEFSGRLDVEFIDVWENPNAGSRYKINLIPTQIFYDTAGKELFRHEGFYSREDILAKWKDLGVDLADKSSITISTETRN